MGNKPVTDFAGIGVVLEGRLKEAGFYEVLIRNINSMNMFE